MATAYVGEYGKIFYFAAGFDMSGKTELEILFTKPDGTTVSKLTADGVAVGTGTPTVDGLGVLVANEHATYTVESGLFAAGTEGTWSARLTYTDATKILKSGIATFELEA